MLAGHPLPTSQWWTSALVGKLSLPMWAVPVALQVTTTGVNLSGATPVVSPDHIVTPFLTDLTAGSVVTSLSVTGFGAFHVVLAVELANGATIEVTLVQGCPIVSMRFADGPAAIAAAQGTAAARGSIATIAVGDRRWIVAATTPWILQDNLISTVTADSVAIGLCPSGTDLAVWTQIVDAFASDPVISTTSTLRYDDSRQIARQTLKVTRASNQPGPFVLMPHHRRSATGATKTAPTIGTYQLPTGHASVISAAELSLEFSSPDPVAKLPTIDLTTAARTAVLADLRQDLADPPGGGGSYNDGKELGRLATIAEVARVIGAGAERQSALTRLKPKLVDWLSYTGIADDKYFAYDSIWGGIIGIPNEYGSEDYNDHHFHYGYHVRAAAILAEADPQFLADYGATVDLLVADYAGSTTIPGLPEQRVFQPYLGHSEASGFALFTDGNNQESSSEAIQAWHAMARWGTVRGNPALVEQGRAQYAIETTCALLYWLAETPDVRLGGYAHTVVGIVWDSKLDFATWFSPMPEAAFGIQLIPLNEGSAYRANPSAAFQRHNELDSLVGGAPRMWGDLFTADLAIADPHLARDILTAGVPREPSTSRAITRYWIELQAAARNGTPQIER